MDSKIKLKVQGLTNSQMQSGAYALILAEDGPRRMPVIVGVSEAQSIAIALEKLNPPRPLTHDLFVSFSQSFQIELLEVFIHRFEGGVFYSKMIFSDGIRNVEIDSRTSDAIAIALRMDCEIYTLESILQKCGIVLEEEDTDEKEDAVTSTDFDPEKLEDKLQRLSVSEIQALMDKAIQEENYEFANIYMQELKRRKKEESDA